MIHVSRCVWIDGVHTYAGPDCPHVDHAGREVDDPIPTGWTVQQVNNGS